MVKLGNEGVSLKKPVDSTEPAFVSVVRSFASRTPSEVREAAAARYNSFAHVIAKQKEELLDLLDKQRWDLEEIRRKHAIEIAVANKPEEKRYG